MFSRLRQWKIQRSVERLHNPNDKVRRKSARTLANLGESCWLEWIKGDSKDFKRLGNCPDPRVFSWLVQALQNRRYRKSAIEGLSILGDERAIDAIVDAIQDRNVRVAGAKALAKLGHPEWLEWIKGDSLDEKRLGETDNEQALQVAKAWEQTRRVKEQRRRQKLEARAERKEEQRRTIEMVAGRDVSSKSKASLRSTPEGRQPFESTETKKPYRAEQRQLAAKKNGRNLTITVSLTVICLALLLGCALLFAYVSAESRWYNFLLGVCMLFAGGFVVVLFFTIAEWGERRFGETNLFNLLLPGSLHEEWKSILFHLLPSLVAGAGLLVAFIGIILTFVGIVALLKS